MWGVVGLQGEVASLGLVFGTGGFQNEVLHWSERRLWSEKIASLLAGAVLGRLLTSAVLPESAFKGRVPIGSHCHAPGWMWISNKADFLTAHWALAWLWTFSCCRYNRDLAGQRTTVTPPAALSTAACAVVPGHSFSSYIAQIILQLRHFQRDC